MVAISKRLPGNSLAFADKNGCDSCFSMRYGHFTATVPFCFRKKSCKKTRPFLTNVKNAKTFVSLAFLLVVRGVSCGLVV